MKRYLETALAVVLLVLTGWVLTWIETWIGGDSW